MDSETKARIDALQAEMKLGFDALEERMAAAYAKEARSFRDYIEKMEPLDAARFGSLLTSAIILAGGVIVWWVAS